jgi:dihydroxy-acid dehydratase
MTAVLDLGKTVKRAIEKQDMLAWQYNATGVSDGIVNGSEGVFQGESACHIMAIQT